MNKNEAVAEITNILSKKSCSIEEVETIVNNCDELYLINITTNNGSDETRLINSENLNSCIKSFIINGHEFKLWSK